MIYMHFVKAWNKRFIGGLLSTDIDKWYLATDTICPACIEQ
jgi:hypothetical protein